MTEKMITYMNKTPERLTKEQLAFFETEGYLMVGDVFDPSDLEPVREELHRMIDLKVTDMIQHGELAVEDSFQEEGFNTRLARISERNLQAAEQIMKYLEGFEGGGYRGKALFERSYTQSC